MKTILYLVTWLILMVWGLVCYQVGYHVGYKDSGDKIFKDGVAYCDGKIPLIKCEQ